MLPGPWDGSGWCDAGPVTPRHEVLFVGGRAGAGKSTVAFEVHEQLCAAGVRHFVVEGDTLDLAWPVPWEHGLHLAETNLAAVWAAYTAAGYSRMVYTNTASVRPPVIASLLAAIGGDPVVHGALLTATDRTAATRLGAREIGSGLERHLASSRRSALELEQSAPAWVRRVATDDRPVADIAREVVSVLGWEPLPEDVA